MESHSIKALSIQISLSGLSFCVLNRKESNIEYLRRFDFKIKLTPEAVLDRLISIIDTEPLLIQPFEKVLILFQNELSNLVPEALFEQDNASDYLKFSSKIIKTDFISYDTIAANKSINVFVPYVNINNYLFEIYGEFEYKHASTILLEHILNKEKHAKDSTLFLNVDRFHFEIVVVKHGELILYNSFEYFTKEDFIYYILFTMEQLKLNPETLKVKLMGRIAKDDALYHLLYTYIRYVEFETSSNQFTSDVEPNEKHCHSLILNSFN